MSDSTAPPRTEPSVTRTVLLRGGEVHSPADPFATAMVVERGQVAWVGSEGAADAFADGVDEVVHLDGALVTPAFTDAHVHLTSTGLARTGLDLSGTRTVEQALDLVRAHAEARPHDRVLLGHGWDAARWPGQFPPGRAQLDEASGGRPCTSPASTSTRRSSAPPCWTWCPGSPSAPDTARTRPSRATPTTPYAPPPSAP